MKKIFMMISLLAGGVVFAQGNGNFMQQQAFAEMQRVSGQVDVIQNNLSDVQQRLSRLEGGGDASNIRQEISALKAAVEDIRQEMRRQREEIVKDLTARISKVGQSAPAAAPKAKPQMAISGTYTIQSGDTLSVIAKAFDTSVKALKEANNLSSDNLRIGQVINIPK